VVDVFTQTPLEGNPLAVFTDAAELDAPAMQRIAREPSLSETVFMVPSRRPDWGRGSGFCQQGTRATGGLAFING
jgi:PhzF family phenazine biosynthesis protein